MGRGVWILLGAASVLFTALSVAAAPIVPRAVSVAHADPGASQSCVASGDNGFTHGACVSRLQTAMSNAYAAPECAEVAALNGGYPITFVLGGQTYTAMDQGECVSIAAHNGRP